MLRKRKVQKWVRDCESWGDEDCRNGRGERGGWGGLRKWVSSGEWFGVRGGGVQVRLS